MVRITTARLATAAALALVATAGLLSTLAQAAPRPKVTICHFDEEGVSHIISISQNALPAHLRNHPGDFEPPLMAFTDADADGFGVGDPELVCVLPEGTATVSGDCNDADGAISPAAAEIPGNDVDENCDGVIEP